VAVGALLRDGRKIGLLEMSAALIEVHPDAGPKPGPVAPPNREERDHPKRSHDSENGEYGNGKWGLRVLT
jgi:hypothetical protein